MTNLSLPTTDLTTILDRLDISDNTRDNYKSGAKRLIDYIEEYGYSQDIMIRYKRHLLSELSLKPSSKRQILTYAVVFMQQLSKEGVIPSDPTIGFKNLKQQDLHVKEGMSPDDVHRVYNVVSGDPRLLSMLYLMIYNGLRQFEVLNILVSDINFDDNKLMIKGKGRDIPEPIDLHPHCVAALKTYISEYEITDNYIYQSPTTIDPKPYSLRWMQKTWTKIFIEAGISSLRTIHGFRHFFITQVLDITQGDTRVAQQLSRIRNLNTIQAYDDRRRLTQKIPSIHEQLIIDLPLTQK